MKRIVATLLVACIVFGLVGCSNGVSQAEYDELKSEYDLVVAERDTLLGKVNQGKNKPISGSEETSKPEELENIENEITEYQLFSTDTDSAIVILKNTTGKVLNELSVELVFYKGDKMLSVENESYFGIPPNRELAYSFSKPRDEKLKLVEYDDVEVNIYFVDDKLFFNDVGEQVSTMHNIGAQNIIIKAENNGEKDIDYLKFGVVYFVGNEVVGFDMAVTSDTISSGKSVTLDADFPNNSDYKKINFDDYVVYLLEAHTK